MAAIAPVTDPNDPTKKPDPNAPQGALNLGGGMQGQPYDNWGAGAVNNKTTSQTPAGAINLGAGRAGQPYDNWGTDGRGAAPTTTADPQAPATPPAAPAFPQHANFSWGVAGKGVEGVDYGNTANWDQAKWMQYYKEHPEDPMSAQALGAAPAVGGTAAPAAPGAPAPPSVADTFQQALIDRLTPKTASLNDPNIQPVVQANQYAEQRNLEHARQLAAENAARGGGQGANSGDFETTLLGLQQDKAAREGQFAGNAIQQQQNLYNQNANQALGLAGNYVNAQNQLDLQRQLGLTDADIRRAALAQQGQLGQGDLNLRGELGRGQLNLGLLSALLQNNQFGRQLGQQNAQFGASLDQSGLLGLLGMLG